MTESVNLLRGVQDINITQDSNLIFFTITRVDHTDDTFEVNFNDTISPQEVDDKIKNTSNLEFYYKKEDVDVILDTDFYTKSQVKEVFRNTVQLENYFTKTMTFHTIQNISSLKNFYDKGTINVLIKTASNLENYYDKSNIDTFIEEINTSTDLENYYSKTAIDDLFIQSESNILFGESLCNYYLIEEVDEKLEDTKSNLTNSSNLTNYYTIDTIEILLSETESNLTNSSNLANYYTKNTTDGLLSDTESNLTNSTTLANYFLKSEVDQKLEDTESNLRNTSDLANYYTKNTTDGLLSDTESNLTNSTTLANYFLKSEVDQKLEDTKSNLRNTTDLANYYTKNTTDTLLSDTESNLTNSTTLANYFLKSEVNQKLEDSESNLRNTSDLTNYYTKNTTDNLLSDTESNLTNSTTLANYFLKSEVDQKIEDTESNLRNTTDLTNYYTQSVVDSLLTDTESNLRNTSDLANYFLKDEVSSLITSASNLENYDRSEVVTEKAIASAQAASPAFLYAVSGDLRITKRRAHDLKLEAEHELTNLNGQRICEIVESLDGHFLYVAVDNGFILKISAQDIANETLYEQFDMNLSTEFLNQSDKHIFIALSHDGQVLYASTNTHFILYQIRTRNLQVISVQGDGTDKEQKCYGLTTSTDNEHVYLTYAHNEQYAVVKYRSVENKKLDPINLVEDTSYLHDHKLKLLYVAPHGQDLFVVTDPESEPPQVLWLNTLTMKRVSEYTEESGFTPTALTVTWGQTIASSLFIGLNNGFIQKIILNADGMNFMMPLEAGEDEITSLHISPDNKNLFVSSLNQKISKFLLRTNAITTQTSENDGVRNMIFHDETYGTLYTTLHENPFTQRQIIAKSIKIPKVGGLVFVSESQNESEQEGEEDLAASAMIHENGLFVGGSLHINQDFAKYDLDVDGDMRITGPSHLENTLNVDKLASFQESVIVEDDVIVKGLLKIENDTVRITQPKTVSQSNDSGEKGEISWDENNLYVCTDENEWKQTRLMHVGVNYFVIKDGSVPTSNVNGGGYLFSEDGALKWKGGNGTITTIAEA